MSIAVHVKVMMNNLSNPEFNNECQTCISRVLAGILELQKPMEIPKTRLYIIVITALAAYNPHHLEQSLHISSVSSNICLLTALKLMVFGY